MYRTRAIISAVSAGLLAISVAACSDSGSSSGDASASTETQQSGASDASSDSEPSDAGAGTTVKIGFVSSLSGTHTGPGTDQLTGFKLYLSEHDGVLGGATVDFIEADDQSNPDTGIQVTKRLVEQNHVDLVVGPLLANVGLAMGNYMETTDTPMFYPIPASGEFLRDLPKNMLISGTAATDIHPSGAWALEEGHLRAVTVCSDYAFGYEQCGGFANTFTDGGGTIVKQLWAPLGTTDFGPYIAQLRSGDYDLIFDGVVGADSVRFVPALRQAGLFDQATILAALAPSDQELIRSMGDAAEGLLSIGHYASGNDDEVTRSFATKFEESEGKIPGYYAASGYFAAQWLDQALAATGGEIADSDSFFAAMRAADLSASVFGNVSIDDHGNIVWPTYIREVVKRDDGQYWQGVKQYLGEFGPTWNYKYDAFTAQPTYNRDYQGIDWPTDCEAFVSDCPLSN